MKYMLALLLGIATGVIVIDIIKIRHLNELIELQEEVIRLQEIRIEQLKQ